MALVYGRRWWVNGAGVWSALAYGYAGVGPSWVTTVSDAGECVTLMSDKSAVTRLEDSTQPTLTGSLAS